jgi:hypothetical protein
MTYEAVPDKPGAYKVVLEERSEGCYVNVFQSRTSPEPEIDRLQDDLESAKRVCREDYGIQDDQWLAAPDAPWHA